MSELSAKHRLLNTLHKESRDRSPVICMGGMMNAAIVPVMKKTGVTLPEAHFDDVLMTSLAKDISRETGFENIAVPFCMTIEAELLGSEINHGTLACEPKIAKEAFDSVAHVTFPKIDGLPSNCRARTVIRAVERLKQQDLDEPVIASLTGPISTAASWVDPITFIKELHKNKEGAHRVLQHVTELLSVFAEELVKAGADVIALGDPTATGEILGPLHFRNYALPYLNELVDRIHKLGVPVIIHICGDIKPVEKLVPQLHSDAISTDAMVNLKALKEAYPKLTTMGNLSTYLLEFGSPDKVAHTTRKLLHDGIDIISPACGLSTSTTLANINALTQTVKKEA
ncbi:TPA: methylcobamide--CoM methyltransferase [Candidatus Sumerlaeota bacterium]|nr:methylcobamide--CoM methyltransferase [Candidatus Sumerlaeota bacterium]